MTAGRSAVQAFDSGRTGHRPPHKPKPLQLIDSRSLVLRDRSRSSGCFESLALYWASARLKRQDFGRAVQPGSLRNPIPEGESSRLLETRRCSVNFVLTRRANFDNLEKFAQNTVARPVKTTRKPHSVHTAHQVRGHKAIGFAIALVLDPKLLA
jgi:hypothetical protein